MSRTCSHSNCGVLPHRDRCGIQRYWPGTSAHGTVSLVLWPCDNVACRCCLHSLHHQRHLLHANTLCSWIYETQLGSCAWADSLHRHSRALHSTRDFDCLCHLQARCCDPQRDRHRIPGVLRSPCLSCRSPQPWPCLRSTPVWKRECSYIPGVYCSPIRRFGGHTLRRQSPREPPRSCSDSVLYSFSSR